MDLIERNKNLVKKFETMINTNDKELAHELVAPDALFYTLQAQNLYTAGRLSCCS